MPSKAAMSWIPKRKECQKMYQGNRYRVTAKLLGCEPIKVGSTLAANVWWENKRGEIDANDRTRRRRQ